MSARAVPCPAGVFGAVAGLTDKRCCEAHRRAAAPVGPPFAAPVGPPFAPVGSTIAPGGGAAAPAPAGPCLPSVCPAGFYCPEGTSAPLPCGEGGGRRYGGAVFCPKGSVEPTVAGRGHYTVGSASAPGSYQKPADAQVRRPVHESTPNAQFEHEKPHFFSASNFFSL